MSGKIVVTEFIRWMGSLKTRAEARLPSMAAGAEYNRGDEGDKFKWKS
jgi:hypothetical protein